jgi:nucleoside-diphosphate-sugar epimerase
MGLTIAVTGPTGEIGMSAVDALERQPGVERILGMARREFDPSAQGWLKTEYRRGDILDRAAVDSLVGDADVVVHLAYIIMGSREESRRINLSGTRNVFEATAAAPRAHRLVYTSSVAAYGYHPDNPVPLTEDVPARGSVEHYYSEQKAECEAVLHEIVDGADLDVYVLRPSIVAGPRAPLLARSMPWRQVLDAVPAALREPLAAVQSVLPLAPDPGVGIQLVHHDDVAAAIALAAAGAGEPGVYNLGGDGTVSVSDVARATGTRSVRIPRAVATTASAVLAKLPLVPATAEWIHTTRAPMVMDTSRAKRALGWQPKYTSAETLQALAVSL